jgi:hypothetical protein
MRDDWTARVRLVGFAARDYSLLRGAYFDLALLILATKLIDLLLHLGDAHELYFEILMNPTHLLLKLVDDASGWLDGPACAIRPLGPVTPRCPAGPAGPGGPGGPGGPSLTYS